VAGKKKHEHRGLADRLHFFPGLAAGHQLSYDEEVGLELNIPRLRLGLAVAVLWALEASGDAPLPREWADAMCDDPEQAGRLHLKINTARAVARAVRKRGR
jgi:hypothetical protein